MIQFNGFLIGKKSKFFLCCIKLFMIKNPIADPNKMMTNVYFLFDEIPFMDTRLKQTFVSTALGVSLDFSAFSWF